MNSCSFARVNSGEAERVARFCLWPQQCRTITMPLKVAVLYSGRFFGSLTPRWTDNHLQHLIRPNRATVIVVSDLLNWCHAPRAAHLALAAGERQGCDTQGCRQTSGWQEAKRMFAKEVDAAFSDWPFIHAELLQTITSGCSRYRPYYHQYRQDCKYRPLWDKVSAEIKRSVGVLPGAVYVTQMTRSWLPALSKFARGAALFLDGGHDLLVRARLDCLFSATLRLSHQHASAQSVFAMSYVASLDPTRSMLTTPCRGPEKLTYNSKRRVQYTEKRDCRILWRDWLYIGSPVAMAPFLNPSLQTAAALITNASERCYGWCPEEQNKLQLQAAGVTLQQLPGISLTLERVPPTVNFWPADPRETCAATGAGQWDWVTPEANLTAPRPYRWVRKVDYRAGTDAADAATLKWKRMSPCPPISNKARAESDRAVFGSHSNTIV